MFMCVYVYVFILCMRLPMFMFLFTFYANDFGITFMRIYVYVNHSVYDYAHELICVSVHVFSYVYAYA